MNYTQSCVLRGVLPSLLLFRLKWVVVGNNRWHIFMKQNEFINFQIMWEVLKWVLRPIFK